MLKKLLASTVAKKTTILAAAFILTCTILGGLLRSPDLVQTGSEAAATGQAAEASASQAVRQTSEHAESQPAVPISTVEEMAGEHAEYEGFPLSGEYPSPEEEPVFTKELADLVVSNSPVIDLVLPTADGFVYTDQIPLSYNLQQYTYRRCMEMGLEYEMILALMWRESGFQLDAVGYNTNGTKDSGVMQINDVNRGWLAEKHGITDLMDPYQNIDAGTIMLSDFTGRYGVHGALMAYQYGEAGMRRQYERGVYTNELITKLLNKRDDYRALLQSA